MRYRLDTRGHPGRRAFTLIELLIAMALMAILASLGLGVTAALRTRSHRDSAIALVRRIGTGLEQYRDTFGDWPAAVRTDPAKTEYPKLANILLGAEAVQMSEVRSGVVVDFWGRRINAVRGGFNTPGLDIWSNGPDGNDDRDPDNRKVYGDDVVNWVGR